MPEFQTHVADRKTKKGSPAVKALVIVCILLLIGCLVAFFQLHMSKNGASEFEKALALAQQHKFSEAKEVLGTLPAILPYKKELSDYIEGGLLMEQGKFEEAKHMFQSLSYLDAERMVLECDYRQGQQLAEQGAYEEAQKLFEALGDYGEAPQWMQECTYRTGLAEYEKLLQTDDYGEMRSIGERVLSLFGGISGHAYAEEMLTRTNTHLYDMALQAFDTASLVYNQPVQPGKTDGEAEGAAQAEGTKELFDDARQLFSLLEGYEQSSRYLALISALDTPGEAYTAILAMWDFQPARQFLVGRYIADFFRGRWSGGGYGIVFDDETYRYYLLSPESDQHAGSGTIFKKSKRGMEMAYSFRVVDQDNIVIIGKKEFAVQRVKEASDGNFEEIEDGAL